MKKCLFFVLSFGIVACKTKFEESAIKFQSMDPKAIGIDFENTLSFDKDFNIYTYRNFYNGGGIATGDLDGDGLADVFFTGNMVKNRLYQNKGNFQFDDMTEKAGIAGKGTWATGAAMADVNGDGLLDIYVCYSGDLNGGYKKNELYINKGNFEFEEMAEAYGLADEGYSTHAAFFDYDRDGDLDMYLLNNSYQAIGSFNLKKNEREKRDPKGGDKLFRNDGASFVDVSVEAGIFGSVIGFGLGVTIGDVNMDGWMDIYVSNDFFERDYLYINQKDGSFREELEAWMQSISVASMGADMADINNDGFPDIFVTEMLPSDDRRLKTKTTFEDWDKYQSNLKNGYYHQFTRNMLHLHDGQSAFKEIGRYAGVHATDWSWGALIADFDNDGHKDLFVSNGIYQDLTDQDFLNFLSNEETMKSIISESGVDYAKLIEAIPSERIPNHMFVNKGNFSFEDKARDWGLATPSHSNGSVYVDLDNDGDLDLLVNNVNMPPFVYKNQSNVKPEGPAYNFFQLDLRDSLSNNSYAVGSKVYLFSNGQMQYVEHNPIKGFQSSMDYVVHFGLAEKTIIDSVRIVWPDGGTTRLDKPTVNSRQKIYKTGMQAPYKPLQKPLEPILMPSDMPWGHVHEEATFVDFDRDKLSYYMESTRGPKTASGDLNGDGLEDLVIGGGKGQSLQVFLQDQKGWKKLDSPLFESDALCEDLGILIHDMDFDGRKDIFVCSGSNEVSQESSNLKNRIYLNKPTGFEKASPAFFPQTYTSDIAVRKADLNGDSIEEILVAEHQWTTAYGIPTSIRIYQYLQNRYVEVTDQIAPSMKQVGMITDFQIADIDGDGRSDVVAVGSYMPICIWIQKDGKLQLQEKYPGLESTSGWWNTMQLADLDGDGKMDMIAGNHGSNSRLKTSAQEPVRLYLNDFDRNGSLDPILSSFQAGKSVPIALKHDLIKQLPSLKKKFLMYKDYPEKEVKELFDPAVFEGAKILEAKEFRSMVFMNRGKKFEALPLPPQAQWAPVHAIQVLDLDGDDILDLLIGGNMYGVRPELGRYDALGILALKGIGDGGFSAWSVGDTGLPVHAQVRDIKILLVQGKAQVFITTNQGPSLWRRLKKQS